MAYFLNMTDCLRIEQLNGTDFRIGSENVRGVLQETARYIFLWFLFLYPLSVKTFFPTKSGSSALSMS